MLAMSSTLYSDRRPSARALPFPVPPLQGAWGLSLPLPPRPVLDVRFSGSLPRDLRGVLALPTFERRADGGPEGCGHGPPAHGEAAPCWGCLFGTPGTGQTHGVPDQLSSVVDASDGRGAPGPAGGARWFAPLRWDDDDDGNGESTADEGGCHAGSGRAAQRGAQAADGDDAQDGEADCADFEGGTQASRKLPPPFSLGSTPWLQDPHAGGAQDSGELSYRLPDLRDYW